MEIKINDRVMIEPTNIDEELILSSINCDFSIPHVVTEAHVWEGDKIFLGFEDYTRNDSNTSIKGAYDDKKLEKEVIELLGRSTFGNAMLLPIACVKKITKVEVGDSITLALNDFADIMMGAEYYSIFGIDIFDGEARKISKLYELKDSDLGLIYMLEFEGVNSLEKQEFNEAHLNLFKENNVEIKDMGNLLMIFPEQIKDII